MLKFLPVILLAACSYKPIEPRAVPLTELRQITVSDKDCLSMDQSIGWLERQQRLAGIPATPPELLNEHDREYQARIRAAVWAIRIGCANPGRYSG